MGKRYNPADEIERVPAGGDYDEWFDVRKGATLGSVMNSYQSSDPKARITNMLCALIAAWSLTDGGQADPEHPRVLPITPEIIADLPVEMLEPLMNRFEALTDSFLALASATRSRLQPPSS